MWFVGIGCLLLVMKLADFGFAATWSWLWILAPFGLAMLWWAFADGSGLTMRRAMDKMEERKHERRRRHMEALGLNWRRDRRVAVIKEKRKVEPPPMAAVKKTEEERHNRDVITAFLPSRQELPPQRPTADDKAT
ncbi:MAG TPA: TIGR04438 family Trp-rich protein [Burkholderiaceae bacterium]|nr:TIGR04438 family Trp-rich protein [Burkholderiaceae bacterium]